MTSTMLERLATGHLVPGVQAFRSGASHSDDVIQEHLYGRSVLKSRKNLQLQVFEGHIICMTSADCFR